MSHDDQHWHATDSCFVCGTCRVSLIGMPFLPKRGTIYCCLACSKGEPPTPSDSNNTIVKKTKQRSAQRTDELASDYQTTLNKSQLVSSSVDRSRTPIDGMNSPNMSNRVNPIPKPSRDLSIDNFKKSSPRSDRKILHNTPSDTIQAISKEYKTRRSRSTDNTLIEESQLSRRQSPLLVRKPLHSSQSDLITSIEGGIYDHKIYGVAKTTNPQKDNRTLDSPSLMKRSMGSPSLSHKLLERQNRPLPDRPSSRIHATDSNPSSPRLGSDIHVKVKSSSVSSSPSLSERNRSFSNDGKRSPANRSPRMIRANQGSVTPQRSPRLTKHRNESKTNSSIDGTSCQGSPNSSRFSPQVSRSSTPSTQNFGDTDPANISLDRLVLEKSLGKLLSNKGIDILRKVASENSEDVSCDKEYNSQTNISEKLDLLDLSDINIDALIALNEAIKNRAKYQESVTGNTSPNLSSRNSPLPEKPSEKQQRSVRFDPSQISEADKSLDDRCESSSSGSAPTARNPLSKKSSGSRRPSRHERRKNSSRVPRSQSYSGSIVEDLEEEGPRKTTSITGLQRSHDWDNESMSSSCSSTSSSDFDYDLPPRGGGLPGVRINYVPNDALALARSQMTPAEAKKKGNADKNCIVS